MTLPWLAIIADDVTGACDVAAAVREAGLRTVLRLGVPDGDLPACDAVVVGLSIRTVDPEDARARATEAALRLQALGADVIYQKYCSTFDSSPRGNIGPVADALAALTGGPRVSVGTPATPAAGRTQYQGHLFVGDRLLSESPLRDHPLTPMRDPDLVRVLASQTPQPVRLLPWQQVRQGPAALTAALHAPQVEGAHVLVDAVDEDDLDVLARALLALRPHPTVGGGAGLAAALARAGAGAADGPNPLPDVAPGQRLIVSGSLSERTREQCAAFPGRHLRLGAATDDDVERVLRDLAAHFAEQPGEPVLVSSLAAPDDVGAVQRRLGADAAGRQVEQALAGVARGAVRRLGVRHLVVAGGETSGAVTRALGIAALLVGDSVAPGVPWTVSTGPRRLGLLLKSGNFGGPDLFTAAWRSTP